MRVIDKEIHEAQRAAIRDRLTATGMEPALADRWCDAWETQAALQRLIVSVGYWELGERWIDAERADGKAPPR